MSHGLILAVLRTIFGYEGYVTMYETIDDDMIRKDAISIKKLKEFESGDCDYSVRINWRLLERAIEQLEMGKEKVTPQDIKHYKEAGAILRSMNKEEE